MTLFKQYIAYFKDNPHGYWFKRKLWGWGWTPVRWQGFLVLAVYIGALLALAFSINKETSEQELFLVFFAPLILLTATLIVICYKTGEKPKWTWGIPKKDDPNKNTH